jgi:hypothetical protein
MVFWFIYTTQAQKRIYSKKFFEVNISTKKNNFLQLTQNQNQNENQNENENENENEKNAI